MILGELKVWTVILDHIY